MRTFLSLLSRNRRLWKRLPLDLGGGRICCSPEATLSVWKPGWASSQALALFEWARQYVQPGMRVWDIGANQGLFTFAAAAQALEGEVIAFEPDLFLVNLLERSLATRSHKGSPVQVMPLAVSDTLCIANFLIAATDRTLNHLAMSRGNPRTGGSRASRPVMVVTLDWLCEHLPSPDLIKIDVEGAEDRVLSGARQLLERHRPIVIVEVAMECSQAVSNTLADVGYLMLDIKAPQAGPISSPAWNTLAFPAERAKEFCQ